jgi:hypothetical protein
MANFVAKYCAPSPVVDVVVTSPTGGALRSTTYRGLLDVSVDTNSGPTLTEGPVQFILPDSLPYPQAQVSSGASLSCSAAPVGFTPIGADVRTVIAGVAAAFVADPRNAGRPRSSCRCSSKPRTCSSRTRPAWPTTSRRPSRTARKPASAGG